MRRSIIAVIFLQLTTCSAVAYAADGPPSISVNGSATIYVTPDQATVSLGVQTFAKDLDAATHDNDAASQTLLKSIHDLGIDDKDVQVDRLSLQIVYQNQNNQETPAIEGYKAERIYEIKLDDVKLFEKLIQSALKNGANELLGFTFDSTQLRQYRDQARIQAAKAAREKADALASALGCKVGTPTMITESDPMPFNYGYASNYTELADHGFHPESQSMPLGQIPIQSQVSVTFSLLK